MAEKKTDIISFLENRRSASAGFLTYPVPDKKELMDILKIGLRCPDHGRLEPWRIQVLSAEKLIDVAREVEKIGRKRGMDLDKLEKSKNRFLNSPLVLVVIFSPKPGKIPLDEQFLSSGAVCMAILNAASAHGWGANWLTGWTAHDKEFKEAAFGLLSEEKITGYIHLGTNSKVLEDRPRPDLQSKVEFF